MGRTGTNMSHNRDINNSVIIQPQVKRPDSVRIKSYSHGNMTTGGSGGGSGYLGTQNPNGQYGVYGSNVGYHERDHTPTQSRYAEAEVKKKRISNNYGVDNGSRQNRNTNSGKNNSGSSKRQFNGKFKDGRSENKHKSDLNVSNLNNTNNSQDLHVTEFGMEDNDLDPSV